MYKILGFLLKTFPSELSNGWYVAARDILLNTRFLA